MIPFLLLCLVGGWFWWKFKGEEQNTVKRESAESATKIAERYAATQRTPDSPAAWEYLGDALREAERYQDAVAAYEYAEAVSAQSPTQGGGWIGGAGLSNKLRLSRMEANQGGMIGAGEAARMQQQLCRVCGNLSAPGAHHCAHCNELLPVDTMRQVWDADDTRKPILREALEFGAIIAVVGIAVSLVEVMPLEIKGVIMISTIAVLGWKFLRLIGGK